MVKEQTVTQRNIYKTKSNYINHLVNINCSYTDVKQINFFSLLFKAKTSLSSLLYIKKYKTNIKKRHLVIKYYNSIRVGRKQGLIKRDQIRKMYLTHDYIKKGIGPARILQDCQVCAHYNESLSVTHFKPCVIKDNTLKLYTREIYS